MKFFSKKVKYDGFVFDSEAEKERYIILKQKEAKHLISNLELQKRFQIIPKLERAEIKHLKTKDKVVIKTDEHPAYYTCDFFYYDHENKKWMVEELKSKYTAKLADYILRRKLIKQKLAKLNEYQSEDEKYEFIEILSQPKTKRKKKKK